MKTFNWGEFEDCKAIVHYKNKAEEKDFLKNARKHGLRNNVRMHENPLDTDYYVVGFLINKSIVEVLKTGSCKILEWSDYMEFTKDDLTVGMIVETNCGSMLVMPYKSGCVLSYPNGKTVELDNLEFNKINKVWSLCDCAEHVLDFTGCGRHLIYERSTVKEMTVEEISEALGYEVKIVKGQ